MTQYYSVDSQGFILEVLDSYQPSPTGLIVITKGWTDSLFTPKFDFAINDWVEGGDKSLILSTLKESKKEEMKKSCEKSILNGFTSSINNHHYRTNRDDQTNMIGQKDYLNDNQTVSTVMWKTEDVGYLEHSREEWLSIYSEAFKYKQNQLFKYDKLKKDIDLCSTVEELDLIVW